MADSEKMFQEALKSSLNLTATLELAVGTQEIDDEILNMSCVVPKSACWNCSKRLKASGKSSIGPKWAVNTINSIQAYPVKLSRFVPLSLMRSMMR